MEGKYRHDDTGAARQVVCEQAAQAVRPYVRCGEEKQHRCGAAEPGVTTRISQTEKHEKAERAAIMRERNGSELEAVYVIAERMVQNRGVGRHILKVA